MALVALFVSAFVVALSGALMPGPVLFVTVRYSASAGRKVGPLVVLGHAVVEVPLMLAVIFGLRKVLTEDLFIGVVGVAGAAVLLLMAGMMFRAVPRLRLPDPEGRDPDEVPKWWRFVGAGALTSLSNPYFVVWWVTVGMGFLGRAAPYAAAGYVVFYLGHVMADLAWYSAVSESVHRGRRLLSDRAYRWLVGGMAVCLAGVAAWFGFDGVNRLIGL